MIFHFFYMKNKINNTKKKKNSKNMLSRTTKLDWLKRKTKHSSYAKQKTRRERKSDRSLGALFLPHLGRTFPLSKPLNLWWGERIETVQVWKENEGFEKISKRSKRGLKLILASKCYHVTALLSRSGWCRTRGKCCWIRLLRPKLGLAMFNGSVIYGTHDSEVVGRGKRNEQK